MTKQGATLHGVAVERRVRAFFDERFAMNKTTPFKFVGESDPAGDFELGHRFTLWRRIQLFSGANKFERRELLGFELRIFLLELSNLRLIFENAILKFYGF